MLKKACQELCTTGLKVHEATRAEEEEEFTFGVDDYAPQHDQRVPRGTAPRGSRGPLTAADKKKVKKASIGLPIPRTLKLATINCNPFILGYSLPVEDIQEERRQNAAQSTNTSDLAVLDFPVLNAPYPFERRQTQSFSTPAIQPRTSLDGTTLFSLANQATVAATQDLIPGHPEDHQDTQLSVSTASPVIFASHLENIKPELARIVSTWLINVTTFIDTEPGLANLVSDFINERDWVVINAEPVFLRILLKLIHNKELWILIDRSDRQRKSGRRQMPITMSTKTNDAFVRGSNVSRSSGSYLRPGESHTRTSTNLIKDHPGQSARRPKNMPSGSQLPSCWNDEMDQFICHMEAQGEFTTKTMVFALKKKYPELKDVSASVFSSQHQCFMLTFALVCDPGRSDPASH